MEPIDDETMLRGQAEAMKLIYGFVDSIAMKCAVDLHIPDIIKSQGGKLTLSQIASNIASPSPNVDALNILMRYLVWKKVFYTTAQESANEETEILYSLSPISRLLVHDNNLNLTEMFNLTKYDYLAPYFCIGEYIKNGWAKGSAFKIAMGFEAWDYHAQNPDTNKEFNDSMTSLTSNMIESIIKGYKNGFSEVNSLVDVGGGSGKVIFEIARAYPHIKGINFDLPHVIGETPAYEGVTHIRGNMFETIPSADAVFLKTVLHNWSDEDCVKILQNCKRSIPKTSGKIIIADIVLQPDGKSPFDDVSMALDIIMMAIYPGGKERTELEWSKLFKKAGLSHYNIIRIPSMLSIIEAYP